MYHLQDWGSGDYYKVAIDGQWGDYGPWTPCCPGKLLVLIAALPGKTTKVDPGRKQNVQATYTQIRRCVLKFCQHDIFHEWSFHMKFMKRAFGTFHKFHIK